MSRSMRLLVAVGLVAISSTSRAEEIGYIEDFALSKDRADALKQLIPGTEDYYYYNCLHLQQQEKFDEVDTLVAAWVKRHNYTARVHQILNRQALLLYDRDPQRTLKRIRERLNLKFNHQREVLGRKPNLPQSLDQNRISRETLAAAAFGRHKNLQGFEDAALDWLVSHGQLNAIQRRHLLQRLQRPDYDGLVDLVIQDLNEKSSPAFGQLPIHRLLLPEQLEECVERKANLLNQTGFVYAWLAKLHPASHVDWQHDREAHEAYLDRLWGFVSRLAPVHNSLKASVLYRRLVFDRAGGVYDKGRFLTYIRLPRRIHYVNQKYLQLPENRQYVVDLNANYSQQILLPPIHNDEALVRSYLAHFFLKESSIKPYEPFLNDTFLKNVLAETKIVNGLGDDEQWSSMLSPAQFQQLKERIDLDFAHTSRQQFGPNEPVGIDLAVKNVKTLIVKVFEINARNYYRDHLREVDTDINLDGLVANDEKTETFDDPPLRRVMRHFDFPTITKPGVYVVDFIGNGKSSRVLIRKGKLRFLVRTSTAGHIFTVLNDRNEHVKNATLWLAGHEYKPDMEGRITTPFTANPGRQPVILSHGDFASIDYFQHEAENYQLAAAIHVDRESLMTRRKASVVVRPSLSVNGTPVTLSVLEDVKLTITSIDHDSVSTTKEVADFKLYEDRESTYEFQVPQRLQSLTFQLTARVRNVSRAQDVPLSAGRTFSLNQIDRSEKIEDVFLTCVDGNYLVELRGRTGEPLADRAVRLSVKHREFREAVAASLKTNAAGRVELGRLEGIDWVQATSPQGVGQRWTLPRDAHTYYQTVHARTGKAIEIPWMEAGNRIRRPDLSLLELRGGTFTADHFKAVRVKNGLLRVQGLAAGEYDLWLKPVNRHIRLRVLDGENRDGFILGETRQLEVRDDSPLQISAAAFDDQALRISLQNASKFTRVHVLATRYLPEFPAYGALSTIRDSEPLLRTLPTVESKYVAGRNIGDEYRYIIDRKYAKKFPGNSLKRPSLILNPWAVRTTSTGQQQAQGGEDFKAAGTDGESRSSRGVQQAGGKAQAGDFSNLDFLDRQSVVLLNLAANEDGIVTVPLDRLGGNPHVQILAIDPQHTASRVLSRKEEPVTLRDLRLADGLKTDRHYTQQKQVSIVPAKGTLEIDDIASSRFELYDSLLRVYSLYATLNPDPKLVEFSFVLNWPELKPAEKREKYSKYASHELSFFLSKKDPKFFQEVVQPYLRNKQHKTFLDHWLLGDDVSRFREPWAYARLNAVERILLAQRLEDESKYTRQLIGDQIAMLPPNPERFQFLYQTALGSSSLEVNDTLGVEKEMERVRTRRQSGRNGLFRGFASGGEAAEATDAAAARPGGFGGGGRAGAKKAPAPPTAAPPESAPAAKYAREAKRKALSKQRQTLGDKLKAEVAAEEMEELGVAVIRGNKRDVEGVMDVTTKLDVLEEGFHADDSRRRESARKFYQKLEQTQELAENNYYHLTLAQQNADLVDINAFWQDYAAADPKKPFFSKHIAEAAGNLTEIMFALSVLDLPFKAKEHKTEFDDARMKLAAGSPAIIFHQEIRETDAAQGDTPILVSQNFFRHGDRTRIVNNEQVEKYVKDEFLTHAVYGCQVIVTNPTSTRQKLNVLIQVPLGAVPVLNAQYTRSLPLSLDAYQTQKIEYHFYFPATGEFPHYPVHVARDEELIANAEPTVLKVVDTPSTIDRGSWDFVSQQGTDREVLTYLRTQNLLRVKLERIAFRMADREMFRKVIEILDRRHIYNGTLWSYAIQHNDRSVAREFLRHSGNFLAQCGAHLESPLVTIDPVERRTYEHLDYSPIVNARAHQLGRRRQILNDRLHGQYHRLLSILSFRRELDDDDLMAVTYYMILQDRIEEALDLFGRVNPQNLTTGLQYDYFTAYLDLFSLEPDRARALTAKYANHPVDRWRKAFAAVAAQLDEAGVPNLALRSDPSREVASVDPAQAVRAALQAGQPDPVDPANDAAAFAQAEKKTPADTEVTVVDDEDLTQNQTKLASTEPSLDFQVEAKQVRLRFQNLKQVRVNYYEMDVELLFSRNPFLQQFSGGFSYVKPNRSDEIKLPKGRTTHDFDLPKEFQSSNVLIEITAAGLRKTQTYYSHSLNAQVVENYGQIHVKHEKTGRPLPRVYVKVYSLNANGTMRFFKDGYTDLRGRFDYASLNTNDLDQVRRFSLLIMSDDHGAVVREAAPPKQ